MQSQQALKFAYQIGGPRRVVTAAFQLGKHLPLVVEVTLAQANLLLGLEYILGDRVAHYPPHEALAPGLR